MRHALHIISDPNRHRLPLLQVLVESAIGGADVIHIRDKNASATEILTIVTRLSEEFEKQSLIASKIYVNDRIDIAIASNASGIHLKARSLPIESAVKLRERTGWRGQIGCSVHHLKEALVAEQAGADYVTFGHIFDTESHPGTPPQGVKSLRQMVEAVSIPVIAIGGINQANVEAILETRCSGIAVIGAVLNAANPLEATKKLKVAIEDSSIVPKVAFTN